MATPSYISFSPDPHLATTASTEINIIGSLPMLKTTKPEDINKTITVNADNNLQHYKQGKLGHVPKHKPSALSAPFIPNDDVIGNIYRKNMVLIPFTIDPWIRFGPMLHTFLTTTHHPCLKPLGHHTQQC
jgi:hypothetical protein